MRRILTFVSLMVLGFGCGSDGDDAASSGGSGNTAGKGGSAGSTSGGSSGVGGGTGGSSGGTGGSSGGSGGSSGGTGGGTGSGGSTGGSGGSGGSTGGSGGSGGFVVSDCGAAALKNLAETTSSGTFVELGATGYDAALIDAGQGHHVLQYSDKGVWDPNTCQALFLGGGHLSLVKYIGLSASSNLWFQAPNPPWWCDPQTVSNPYQCSTHAYQHDALDPATGTFYFRGFNSATVRRHQVDATIDADWDTITDLPSGAASCIATSLEFFPDRNELVYVNCTDQSLNTWKPGGSSWATVTGPFAMGDYHNYGVYNPVHKVVMFGLGNGSTGFHKYDAAGTVVTAQSPPRTFHPSPGDQETLRILTVDPVSGKYLAVAPNGDMFEYDVPGDQWSPLTTKAPEGLQVAIPVSSYGVVLFLANAPAEVYIYKH
jgi:hypothetical protein